MKEYFFQSSSDDALNRPRQSVDIFPLDGEDAHTSTASGHKAAQAHCRRTRRILAVFGVVFIAFVFRIGYLQIGKGEAYAAIAEQNRIRMTVDSATRGLIVDRFGRPVVRNVPQFVVTVTPFDLPRDTTERTMLIEVLGELLGRDPLALIEVMRTLPQDALLARQQHVLVSDIDISTALRVMVAERSLPGVSVVTRYARTYPNSFVGREGTRVSMPNSLAHIIGYLGSVGPQEWEERRTEGYQLSDLVGKRGVEQSYDRVLHGKHGRTFTEITALGTPRGVVRSDAAVPGETVTLTIDLDLQRIMEEELVQMATELGERERTGVVGIALEPNTGAVRAAVSLPAYDPRLFGSAAERSQMEALFRDPGEPLFFRAISGRYPSGSTIKPLIALAALEEGVIGEHTSFVSTGGLAVGGSFFPDWLAGGHGVTDVRRAIAQSVNTFFYIIGGGYGDQRGLGVERIADWLRRFRVNTTLGIDIPGEAVGLVPTPEWKEEIKGERWFLGNTYHLAIGQGDLLVTPLHIAAMTAYLANGGLLMQPFVVEQEPIVLAHDIASAYNVTLVRAGMRQAVTSGSAARLTRLPVSAAGKTGTAQWSATRPPHAWFTGWAPYDKPELTITILIEEGEEGSKSAVTVAERVLARYFSEAGE